MRFDPGAVWRVAQCLQGVGGGGGGDEETDALEPGGGPRAQFDQALLVEVAVERADPDTGVLGTAQHPGATGCQRLGGDLGSLGHPAPPVWSAYSRDNILSYLVD